MPEPAGERPADPFRVPADNWAGRHPLLAALLAPSGALLLGLAILWLSLPEVEALAEGWPERTAYMRLRVEQAAREGRDLEIAYRPVPLSRVPAAVQRAALVAEDAAFYGHGGFDWHELQAAVRKAWEERSLPRGASTITQQLARNLYLSPRQNLLRKAKEALIAWKLERELPKRRILELYLNVIEFGPGVFGVDAASRHYFGIGVASVGPRQAAELAAAIPSPLRDNPATGSRRFRWRTGLVYRRAFGPAEEREEIAPPPDSLAIRVAPPTLPGAALPAPDTVGPLPSDTTGMARPDTALPDTLRADTARAEATRVDAAGAATTPADTAPADTARAEAARRGPAAPAPPTRSGP